MHFSRGTFFNISTCLLGERYILSKTMIFRHILWWCLFLKTSNRRGTQFHAWGWSNCPELSSRPDWWPKRCLVFVCVPIPIYPPPQTPPPHMLFPGKHTFIYTYVWIIYINRYSNIYIYIHMYIHISLSLYIYIYAGRVTFWSVPVLSLSWNH